MTGDPAPPTAGEVVPVRPAQVAGRGGDEAADEVAWSTAFGAQRLPRANEEPAAGDAEPASGDVVA